MTDTAQRQVTWFLYPLGTAVSLDTSGALWMVEQQRVTYRTLLGPIREYLVHNMDGGISAWMHEADIREVAPHTMH